MKELFENASKIIAEASKSALGVSSLVVLVIAFLAWSFFDNSSELVKVGIFLPIVVLVWEIIRRSFNASHNKENRAEEIELSPPEDPPDVVEEKPFSWSPLNNKSELYHLGNEEVEILEVLRGKPDIHWTQDLIINKAATTGKKDAADYLPSYKSLIKNSYLREDSAGKVIILPLAVDYFRATVDGNEYHINEEDYWDGN